MIRSPTDEEATVVTRGETQSRTAHETLTKPPKEKTAIQKYQDMEESAIDQAALEGRSSSSSDAEEQNPIPKHAQPQDANGGVAVKKAADDVSSVVVSIDHLHKELRDTLFSSRHCSKHHCLWPRNQLLRTHDPSPRDPRMMM